MKLKLDEKLPESLLPEITHLGHDIDTVRGEALSGSEDTRVFYLCVVDGIPNLPTIRLVQNPASIGNKDRLTVGEQDWKAALEPSPLTEQMVNVRVASAGSA